MRLNKSRNYKNAYKTGDKLIKHEVSFAENVKLLHDFLAFAEEHGIKVVFVVTPATRYYTEIMLPEYKEIFYDVMEQMEEEIHIVDLFDSPYFVDEDFIDPDHLNDS